MDGLLHLVEGGGDWVGPQPVQILNCCIKMQQPNHQRPVYQTPYCCITVRCSAVFKGLSVVSGCVDLLYVLKLYVQTFADVVIGRLAIGLLFYVNICVCTGSA